MLPEHPTQDPPSSDAATWRQWFLKPSAWTLLIIAAAVVVLLYIVLLLTVNGPGGGRGGLFDVGRAIYSSPGLLSVAGFAFVVPGIFFLVFLGMVSSAVRAKARQRALGVVGYLSSAVRLRVPLPPYLRAAAKSEAPAMARRLRRSAAMLDRGDPIGTVLRATASELPPLLIDRIAAAEQSHTASAALPDMLDRQRMLVATREPNDPVPTYALIVSSLILAVTTMLMIFIVPKYAQIFRDFRLTLPPVTQALIDVSSYVANSIESYALFFCVAVVAGIVMVSRSIVHAATGSAGTGLPRPARRWAEQAAWFVPVVGPFTRDRHTALACETLADALRAGRPMPEAIGIATLPSLNVVLHDRMVAWRGHVEAGRPTAAAARDAGLPGLLGDVLAGAAVQEGNNAANAVEFAGRAYAARAVRLAAIVSAMTPVLTTLVLAAGVGFVALAMFTPIVKLIRGMGG